MTPQEIENEKNEFVDETRVGSEAGVDNFGIPILLDRAVSAETIHVGSQEQITSTSPTLSARHRATAIGCLQRCSYLEQDRSYFDKADPVKPR
jgi:hypothetical protein